MIPPHSHKPQNTKDQNFHLPEDFPHGCKRIYDTSTGYHIVRVLSGEWYVSIKKKEILSTVLGSCVSACIRDPVAKISGMNHFLLPGDDMATDTNDAARYGVFAMESLMNDILKAGGRKEHLEIKVFGGGNIIKTTSNIGTRNAKFIREFIRKEGLRMVTEDLEGNVSRTVHFYTDTGKVLVRKMEVQENIQVFKKEQRFKDKMAAKPVEGDVDLF